MESQNPKGNVAKASARNLTLGLGLAVLGLGIAAGGIYVGETDDAPGAALLGLVLMVGLVVLGARSAWHKS
jgi:hypothetical protein